MRVAQLVEERDNVLWPSREPAGLTLLESSLRTASPAGRE